MIVESVSHWSSWECCSSSDYCFFSWLRTQMDNEAALHVLPSKNT